MKVVCAWCNKTLSPGDPDGPISHGVCAECAAKMTPSRRLALQQLLDRLPLPAIAVDANITATCANRAAEKVLGKRGTLIQGQLVGNVIECAYAADPEGCGRSVHCAGCAIRRMATATFQDGKSRCSAEADQDVLCDRVVVPTRYTISTQKFGEVVLVIIEDIKVLATDAPFIEQTRGA